MSVERSEHVMRTYLERVVGGGEMDLLDDLAHDDMRQVPDVWGPGREGLRRHASWFRSCLQDPVVEIRRLVAGEDHAVAYWTATGAHVKEFFGVAPTGRPATSVATSWFALRDGRIEEYYVVGDRYEILKSLGQLD